MRYCSLFGHQCFELNTKATVIGLSGDYRLQKRYKLCTLGGRPVRAFAKRGMSQVSVRISRNVHRQWPDYKSLLSFFVGIVSAFDVNSKGV